MSFYGSIPRHTLSGIVCTVLGFALSVPGSLYADASESVDLPAMVVTPRRMTEPVDSIPFAVDVVSAGEIATGGATLDEALSRNAAFSLFRRGGSLSSHPTAHGSSLRGVGPNAAGRTLVLLDGIPLSDPFGGWIPWGAVPLSALESIETVRGGGSGVWGSAALGGVIHARTKAATDAFSGRLRAEYGSRNTAATEANVSGAAAGLSGTLAGRLLETDGHIPVGPGQRGDVDAPAFVRQRSLFTRVAGAFDNGPGWDISGLGFSERRGNGTGLQRNQTRFTQIGGRIHGPEDSGWNMSAYHRRQNFASTFTSVDPSRNTETLANDQYSVPAQAWGAAFTWQGDGPRDSSVVAGIDARQVDGETREQFFFINGVPQRERQAGGRQSSLGGFAAARIPVARDTDAGVSLRTDYWRMEAGFLRELNLNDGSTLTETRPDDRFGWSWTPSLGLSGKINGQTRWRAAVYESFRLPTLNELYRPFRVGAVTTRENPGLSTESNRGIEAGFDFSGERGTIRVGGFASELRRAVANVTDPASPDGTLRRRENLDAVETRGLEAAFRFNAGSRLVLGADLMRIDSEIKPGAAAPELTGNRPAQTPDWTATVLTEWTPADPLLLRADLRWSSDQFEDDTNTRRLGSAAAIDLSAAWHPAPGWTLVATVENAANHGTVTGEGPDGVRTLAPPRTWRVGIARFW